MAPGGGLDWRHRDRVARRLGPTPVLALGVDLAVQRSLPSPSPVVGLPFALFVDLSAAAELSSAPATDRGTRSLTNPPLPLLAFPSSELLFGNQGDPIASARTLITWPQPAHPALSLALALSLSLSLSHQHRTVTWTLAPSHRSSLRL
ncbi:hypothetical protein P280DRAFT_520447 [Massarina eburnea CBS 473.64]|uniref:Uncharacterized protein n=1 Tax=Massarina eburnea CBS 473.64 TaxID=1395130 RepID=A0A6A6RS29_9PLEO|nr:hypothetical protein P280DRAFT_520447 [Massarina eburnea CBS 473.64]